MAAVGARDGHRPDTRTHPQGARGYVVGVQTFLPYADFARSAAVLDRTRLGKQRVEAIQVVRALTIPTYGWRHHPAALI